MGCGDGRRKKRLDNKELPGYYEGMLKLGHTLNEKSTEPFSTCRYGLGSLLPKINAAAATEGWHHQFIIGGCDICEGGPMVRSVEKTQRVIVECTAPTATGMRVPVVCLCREHGHGEFERGVQLATKGLKR